MKSENIEQLRKRYQQLNEARVTANANYVTARDSLDQLKAQAQKEYATDDLDALKAKLKEMESENERKRAEYQAHLDKIEADLKEVDRKFSAPAGQK